MRPAAVYPKFVRRAIPAVFVILVGVTSACSSVRLPNPTEPAPVEAGAPLPATRTPFQPVISTQVGIETVAISLPGDGQTQVSTPTSSPAVQSPTPAPPLNPGTTPVQEDSWGVWVAPYLPESFRNQLSLTGGFKQVDSLEQAAAWLEVGEENPVSLWVYALVAPFPTLVDGVEVEDLRLSWQGEAAGPFAGEPILLDENTLQTLAAWWGGPKEDAVHVVPPGELLSEAWNRREAWAIVPFDSLVPEWKVLQLDGRSPLWKEFDPADYALTIPISLAGDSALLPALLSPESGDGSGIPATNRDSARLTILDLTGVTAMVRATAFTMNRNGITYPAQDIGGLLRSADFTHISNEIPFSPDCPPPNPTQPDLRFCSDPEYIALLEDVGTDIVELTGDHFGDWGPDAMSYTLDMYKEKGWTYYGGGYDRADAREARLVEHNGNRLAFIGCNAKGGGYATASESQPGAVACDYDWMHAEIARLAKEGYQVVATFQHFEYYTYNAQPDQIADFRGMAEAGAVVVSGSQAHQPQGMEFHSGAFIHYGLGNLFFDQYNFCTDNACNDGFIDRHVFYDGRYLSTELIPIVFVDYARPRPMNPDEKTVLLEKVFSASGW